MQEVFEKIKQRIRIVSTEACGYAPLTRVVSEAELKDIIDDVVAENNNGWIDVECELPTDSKYILLSFSNFSVPCVGRYEEDENGGAFYIGDEDETCVQQNMFVNAWMPLPETYTKGE